MKAKKRLLSLLLTITLCLTQMVVTNAEVTSSAMIIGATNIGQAGDTVDVVVSLWGNPGITSMTLSLDYNQEMLELTDVQDAGLLSEQAMFVTSPDMHVNPYKVIWNLGVSDSTANGKLLTLSFKIKETAVNGKYEIGISCSEDDIYNVALENVPFHVINGNIVVENPQTSTEPVPGEPVLGEKEEPKQSEMPEQSAESAYSEVPKASSMPMVSKEPEVTNQPEKTTAPEVTCQPEITLEPEVSTVPEASKQPEESIVPEDDSMPEHTWNGVTGDADGNQVVDLKDAQMILKIALKITDMGKLSMQNIDVDKDGAVGLKDAQAVLKKALKITNGF